MRIFLELAVTAAAKKERTTSVRLKHLKEIRK
jgi:hypothetical protein